MSIISRLISQINNEIITNNEQLLNVIDLPSIPFSIILSPNPQGKILTNSQSNPETTDENKNSKVYTVVGMCKS